MPKLDLYPQAEQAEILIGAVFNFTVVEEQEELGGFVEIQYWAHLDVG